jgi:hypothetical protein
MTQFSGIINFTFSHTTTKDKRTNLMAKIGMERRITILAQPKPTTTLATTTPRIFNIITIPKVDDKSKEIEATNMEK